MSAQFLPVNRQDMAERGWHQVDFVYVSGDAYVDHPSFGAAIITRLVECTATGWASSRSPIGTTRPRWPRSASRGWRSSCRPATWTPW